MKRKIVGVALLAVFGMFVSCMSISLPTARETGLSFSTEAMEIPENIEWGTPGKANEMLNVGTLEVLVAQGENAISEEEWENFTPALPWAKNIERHLLFSGSLFLGSPAAFLEGIDPDAVSEANYRFTEVQGYSWLELAQPVAIDFIPAGEEMNILKPDPGHLVVKTILKPQIIRFSEEIYQLADNRGNFYVMHATETGSPQLNVQLPEGWSLRKIISDEPLIISPSKSGYYNVLGDHLGQGYHQYIFADSLYPPEG